MKDPYLASHVKHFPCSTKRKENKLDQHIPQDSQIIAL